MDHQKDESSTTLMDPAAALSQVFTLLKAKDDTSRFVGLSLLCSLLDTHDILRNDPDIVVKSWAAIPSKFLNRLLNALEGQKRTKDEANSMNELAVSVIHVFTILLPLQAIQEDKMLSFCGALVKVLQKATTETTTLVVQVLVTLSSQPKGGDAMWEVDNVSPLLKVAKYQEPALRVVQNVLLVMIYRENTTSDDLKKWDDIVSQLLASNGQANTIPILEMLASAFGTVQISGSRPPWLQPLLQCIRETILQRPTLRAQKATVVLSSNLLHSIPRFSQLLFSSQSSSPKQFSYVFINLTLIDIRSTIPSLMESLASSSYIETAFRLAASYDIVGAFIAFLVSSLDAADDSPDAANLAPDMLLRLRKDIAETMSLTIEFLRDRWDAAVSGAAGLHPSARPSAENPGNANEPLAITWDSKAGNIVDDVIVVGSVNTLSLWLREDENDQLREEAVGIIDVLLALYDRGLKSPVLTALEGVLAISNGMEAFLDYSGWSLLSNDLKHHLAASNSGPYKTSDALPKSLAMDVIRILLMVVESADTSRSGEEWIDCVKVVSDATVADADLDLWAAAAQLAVELVSKAPVRLRKRYEEHSRKILHAAESKLFAKQGGVFDGETKESLLEVAEGMRSLL
ncbi:Neurochondrin-domain-containing protein [Cryomyces antarcticus]